MDVVLLNGGIVSLGTLLSRSIGPYKIAHWIRKKGHSCQVIDFVDRHNTERMYAVLKKFITQDTLILGISTTFICEHINKYEKGINYGSLPTPVVDSIKQIKTEFPKLKVVLGGFMSQKINGHGIIDCTIMSYKEAAEDIFLEYLEYLKLKTPAPLGELSFPDFSEADRARMMYTRARNPTYNIEVDDFKFTVQDCILPGEPLPLDISRGCIFACRFCQHPNLGKKKLDYIRGMQHIEQELIYNYETFGTDKYYLLDDTFNDTVYKMQEFYNMTQRLPFKIRYVGYLRADLIDRFPDMAYLLQESGSFGAFFGIESLHPEASKVIAKGWSGSHAREYIPKLYHDIWKGKIPVHTSFIVGLPKETPASIQSTVDWFIENKLHSAVFNILNLWSEKNRNSRNSIRSEFEKNCEKYGFTFITSPKSGAEIWKNDIWDKDSATIVAIDAKNQLAGISRTPMWRGPGLLWYGFSEEQVLNTPESQWDWKAISNTTDRLIDQYYAQLLSL